jgi:hypothetical protein
MAPAKKAAAKKATAKKATAKKTTAKKATAKKATAKKTTAKKATAKKATAKKATARKTTAAKSAQKDSVVIASKLKEAVRSHDIRMASDFVHAVSEQVHDLVEKAVNRARANRRGTVRPEDL